ncbi:pre-pilin peptidase [Bifidobacterium italicum]|uniref:Pre-pilin peptidase n=1 Tax=Bifidobacterium italicum TaxID=1960968 RepID=A0A2A2EK54_9BIFI|nr:phosphatase PAP2 family protein [Bifidobacterium italicum]PAU69330.1 pre-pilin peptidase [Bifidobacterium italicum]
MTEHMHDTPSAHPDADAPQPAAGATHWSALEKPQRPAPLPVPQDGPDEPHEEDVLAQDMKAKLAQLDPLTLRPRTSSVVLGVVFGVVFLAIAAAVYWLGVRTVAGQTFEDLAIVNYASTMPSWLSFGHLQSPIIIGVALAFGAVAFAVAALRRRWWLVGQLVAYSAVCFAAARLLKPYLPRPFLVYVESSANNSAPSGHTMLAAAAGLVLLCAVPHAWRAACAVLSTLCTIAVGVSVVFDQWHRPSDVVMAMFIAGGLMMLMLACTRASGMDRPGDRVSSPSIQLVATALITLGLCAIAYGVYVIWQVQPGLVSSAGWAASGSCAATTALVFGCAALVNGMVLMMRQLTAAPLTKLGLIGAPPAPPKAK